MDIMGSIGRIISVRKKDIYSLNKRGTHTSCHKCKYVNDNPKAIQCPYCGTYYSEDKTLVQLPNGESMLKKDWLAQQVVKVKK